VRRRHFEAFAPHCPRCARDGAGRHQLTLDAVLEERDDDVLSGILHCPNPACRHEYPIIDGIPVIVPALGALLAERGIELLLREDLDPVLESLIGDAIGPGTWLDTLRQTVSTYAWDGWADLDPDEAAADPADGVQPGAVRRCLARLLDMAGTRVAGRVIDVGCGAGRTAFDLAARGEDTLVLGVDIHLALLRLARRAAAGVLSYPRRRIGIVYDRRRFPVPLPGADRVDFWACDALALPFGPGTANLAVALNLLDCVSEPRRLLAGLAEVVHTDGRVLLATPYDWSIRATQVETWIGGHSQRAAHEGAAEPFLRALLTEGAHPQSVAGLRVLAEQAAWPWQTRLHDRSAVLYRAHLLALVRTAA
jgi:SAM-dependent methyltransferase